VRGYLDCFGRQWNWKSVSFNYSLFESNKERHCCLECHAVQMTIVWLWNVISAQTAIGWCSHFRRIIGLVQFIKGLPSSTTLSVHRPKKSAPIPTTWTPDTPHMHSAHLCSCWLGSNFSFKFVYFFLLFK
jgi:hypothetical protein